MADITFFLIVVIEKVLAAVFILDKTFKNYFKCINLSDQPVNIFPFTSKKAMERKAYLQFL